jgi:hypothetical protein
MSEQQFPTMYAKVDRVPYLIGAPFPEIDFAPPVKEDSLLCSVQGFQRQVDEWKKQFPDKNEMNLYFMRYMTEAETEKYKNSDKHERIDGATIKGIVDAIANSNTTKGL